jgi:Tfp pilus assembly protein FimT
MRSAAHRRGLTLLELLLALALTVLVVAIVAGAMRFQLITLESSRGRLEESQLARAVMRKLAADIRSTVQEAPIDFSAVSKLAEGSLLGGDVSGLTELAGSDAAASLGGGELAGLDSEEAMAEAESFDMQQMTASTTPSSKPGLYGTTNAIQIDVSRLPRLDEYQRVTYLDANGQARTEFPSDVKTVTYYLRPPQSTGGATTTAEAADYVNRQMALDPQQMQAAGGLVRREVDRAVALWKT